MANYQKILKADIANGLGFRVTVFFTGCPIQCPGCFNKSIWDPSTGKLFTQETIDKIIKTASPDWCEGLSILGGEPTADWNIEAVIDLAKQFKQAYPSKNIWMWSGRYMNEIASKSWAERLLSNIDVLIDGPFVESLKDLSLVWRGSSNQRLWRKDKEGTWRMTSDPML